MVDPSQLTEHLLTSIIIHDQPTKPPPIPSPLPSIDNPGYIQPNRPSDHSHRGGASSDKEVGDKRFGGIWKATVLEGGATRRKAKGLKIAAAYPQYETVPNAPPLLCPVTSKCVESNPPAFFVLPVFPPFFRNGEPVDPPPTHTDPSRYCMSHGVRFPSFIIGMVNQSRSLNQSSNPPPRTSPVVGCPTVPQAKSLWVPWIWTVEYPRTDPTAEGRQRAPPKLRGGMREQRWVNVHFRPTDPPPSLEVTKATLELKK